MAKKLRTNDNEAAMDNRVESSEGEDRTSFDQESHGELVEALERSREEAAENYDNYLRASAELENYKKRAAKEYTDAVKYGNEKLLKDILPIIDSLERALEYAENSDDFAAFIGGLQLVYDKLLGTLEKHGVERIEAVGNDFDPNFHEAMLQVESEDHEDNKIVEEFEKGYLLNGRLLRPVKAAISKNVTK